MLTEKDVLNGFEEGICCAMAVLGELTSDAEIDKDVAQKMASGFGSGMGYGNACGCVTGSLMAMGIKYGNSKPGQLEQKDLIKQKRKRFLEEFKEKFGCYNCAELLGNLNPNEPDERKIIDEEKRMDTICPAMICATCEMVRKIMQEE
ncbi:C-GCAxxG-C-C family protein [Mediterraneibacter massiliensis]|uniref:C-GCAxxG-C-C family protein n=1 Tax=Mediterraneibacter massiliensis TaxID=1720300 RepID=UPI0022E838F0|nr:C-GCAxxG-C-C family protein [Mediterraneibacter massiliensis]